MIGEAEDAVRFRVPLPQRDPSVPTGFGVVLTVTLIPSLALGQMSPASAKNVVSRNKTGEVKEEPVKDKKKKK